MTSPLPTITEDTISLAPGDELILRFRTWEDYEALLGHREDKAGLRIRYNSKNQEIRIISPSLKHANQADLLADLVKALLRHEGKDWDAFTPITLKRINQQGIEPDYCFYIDNRASILGKERIDLETEPAPDLVIEIDLTCATKPKDYQAISPLELWIYRQSQLSIVTDVCENMVRLIAIAKKLWITGIRLLKRQIGLIWLKFSLFFPQQKRWETLQFLI